MIFEKEFLPYIFHSAGTVNFCNHSSTPFDADNSLVGDVHGNIGGLPNIAEFAQDELLKLDHEGRVVLTEHKIMQVLIRLIPINLFFVGKFYIL